MSEKETPEFIPSQLWPPYSPDLDPVDYGVLEILQEKVYKTRITDLNELKQRLRMESCRHIAAAIRHDHAPHTIAGSATGEGAGEGRKGLIITRN